MLRGPLFRHPAFLKFWAGQTISVFGDAITLLALPLTAVLTLHASAAQMGLLTAAGLAPHLALSLFAGVWIDRRRRRRRIMVAADIGRAALLAWVPLAAAFDAVSLAQLYAVALAAGVLTVFFDLAYSSLFVLLVPRDHVIDANSKLSLSRSVSWIGGPPLAGALVQLLTAPFALVADAASFLASALLLGRISVDEPEVEHVEGEGLRRRLGDGFRFVVHQPILRSSLACVATINLFNFAFYAIFVLYVTRELGIRPGLLGAILGVGALGAALGALVAPRVERWLGIGPCYLVGTILFPAPLVLVPLAGGPRPLVVLMLGAAEFLSGIGVMLLDVPGNALSVLLTPYRIRSRVYGTQRFVNYGIRPLGALLGGTLGSAIGLRPTLWMATLGACAGFLWLLASLEAGTENRRVSVPALSRVSTAVTVTW